MEKEKSLKILAIQMGSELGDKWENFSKAAELIEKNIKKSTDIVVLPEVWNVGWKPDIFQDSAEDLENSETVEFLSELAQKFNVNIIGGSFITKRGAKYYNTCPVINREGELIATYDKMHLYSYYGCDEGKFITEGKNPVIVEYSCDTGKIASGDASIQNCNPKSRNDVIKMGLTVCYDIRFPEIFRAYRKAGADVLINVAAWGLNKEIPWEVLTRARAIENQCFMVAVTQSGEISGKDWNLGHSRIINYDGKTLGEVGIGDTKETSVDGAFTAELKFKEMYEFREKCTVLLDIHDKYDVK